MDQQLEARLRTDPTGDPRHVPGQFRDRLVLTVGVRVRPGSSALAVRPLGALLAAALLVAAALLLRPAISGPGGTPSPATLVPSGQPTVTSEELRQVVELWLDENHPGEQPPISVTTIGPTGAVVSYGTRTEPVDPPSVATARIGEISRIYVAAAIVLIDNCSRAGGPFSCAKPIFPTTLRLDDPVARWSPGWPAADSTTIRQLLEGSSGLAPVAADLADLTARIAAAPGAHWSRPAVIARTIASPRLFAPGERREPVDSEWLVLADVIEAATGRPSSQVIPTGGFILPVDTAFADQPLVAPMPAGPVGSESITDLDPAVLALVGNASGMSATSHDLAGYAVTAWNTGEMLNQAVVGDLTDIADGRAFPLGALGSCPCEGETRMVILQVGRAVGWSSIIAYDFQTHTAFGVVIGHEWPADELQRLLQGLVTITP